MAEHQDWESEGAADTLIRAEEIKKNSGLYEKAKAVMAKRHEAMMSAMESMGTSAGMRLRMKRRGLMNTNHQGEKGAQGHSY